jgi:hypothetical protein
MDVGNRLKYRMKNTFVHIAAALAGITITKALWRDRDFAQIVARKWTRRSDEAECLKKIQFVTIV